MTQFYIPFMIASKAHHDIIGVLWEKYALSYRNLPSFFDQNLSNKGTNRPHARTLMVSYKGIQQIRWVLANYREMIVELVDKTLQAAPVWVYDPTYKGPNFRFIRGTITAARFGDSDAFLYKRDIDSLRVDILWTPEGASQPSTLINMPIRENSWTMDTPGADPAGAVYVERTAWGGLMNQAPGTGSTYARTELRGV